MDESLGKVAGAAQRDGRPGRRVANCGESRAVRPRGSAILELAAFGDGALREALGRILHLRCGIERWGDLSQRWVFSGVRRV